MDGWKGGRVEEWKGGRMDGRCRCICRSASSSGDFRQTFQAVLQVVSCCFEPLKIDIGDLISGAKRLKP